LKTLLFSLYLPIICYRSLLISITILSIEGFAKIIETAQLLKKSAPSKAALVTKVKGFPFSPIPFILLGKRFVSFFNFAFVCELLEQTTSTSFEDKLHRFII
jgi:hypothetical protein